MSSKPYSVEKHLTIIFLLCFAAITVTAQSTPDCVPSAPDGYPGKACAVTIDRDNPASPPTMVVRGNTSVTIKISHARWNENISFTPVTTRVTNVDVIGAFLKNAISPLQGLIFAQEAHSKNFFPIADPIGTLQDSIREELNQALVDFSNVNTQLNCLEKYKVLKIAAKYECATEDLTAANFIKAKEDATRAMNKASSRPLPIAELKAADAKITTHLNATLAMPDGGAKTAILQLDNKYLSNQALLNAVLNDAQTTQKTLLETAVQLQNLPGAAAEATYTIKQFKNYNSVVTITAQEVISKTATPLGTVTISWQTNPWEISTGILFSNLKMHSYMNAPLIVGGQPVLDSGGKNLTRVTESDTSPSVIFPMVLASYRIRGLSNASWENKCPNHCAILLSGGVGANLTSKTADFATGPSFQIGGVMFTPAVHFGRELRLTNGVVVGAQLGSSPPALPTEYKWVRKFGFAITYVLPFQ